MIVSSYLNESWHNIIYTMTTSFYRFRLVVYIGRKGILCYLQWFYKILCNALSLLRIIISVLNAAFGKLFISFSLSLSSIYFLGTFKSICHTAVYGSVMQYCWLICCPLDICVWFWGIIRCSPLLSDFCP